MPLLAFSAAIVAFHATLAAAAPLHMLFPIPRDDSYPDDGVSDAPQSSAWVAAVVVILVVVITSVLATVCYVNIRQRRRRRERAERARARTSGGRRRGGRRREPRRADSQASSFSDATVLMQPVPAVTSEKGRRSPSDSGSERSSLPPGGLKAGARTP